MTNLPPIPGGPGVPERLPGVPHVSESVPGTPEAVPAPPTRRRAAGATHAGDARGHARTVIVAGAAGGVGTTTIAALVTDVIGARLGVVVQASDHSTGDLAARLPRLDAATSRVGVHDIGAHARAAGPLATPPENAVVLVASATPAGIADATVALRALAASVEVDVLARTVVVLVDRRRGTTRVNTAAIRAFDVLGIVEMRFDGALLGAGTIVSSRCTVATNTAVAGLVSLLGW